MKWIIKRRLISLIREAAANNKLCDVSLWISLNKTSKITTGKVKAGELLVTYERRFENETRIERSQVDDFLAALNSKKGKYVRFHSLETDDKYYFILTDEPTRNLLSFFSIPLSKVTVVPN